MYSIKAAHEITCDLIPYVDEFPVETGSQGASAFPTHQMISSRYATPSVVSKQKLVFSCIEFLTLSCSVN